MEAANYDLTSFRKDLDELQIHLSKEQEQRFLAFYELLIEWNEVMNLTAITEFHEVIKKHFVDSLSLVKVVPEIGQKKLTQIDVGTGGGFPSILL